MRRKNESASYGSPLIALHWVMLLLIVLVYACIELRVFYPKGSEIREALKTWHFMLGLGVFVLVWVRLVVRLRGSTPPISHAAEPEAITVRPVCRDRFQSLKMGRRAVHTPKSTQRREPSIGRFHEHRGSGIYRTPGKSFA